MRLAHWAEAACLSPKSTSYNSALRSIVGRARSRVCRLGEKVFMVIGLVDAYGIGSFWGTPAKKRLRSRSVLGTAGWPRIQVFSLAIRRVLPSSQRQASA